MIYAQQAELRCDEEGCGETLRGSLVATFGGGFVFASPALKEWQVCPTAPDPSALMVSFCGAHKKQLTSLVQVGPAGPRVNPQALKELKKTH